MGGEGSGSLISPDGVAPSEIVGVSPSDISPYTIKSTRRFLLAPAHLGSPRKRALCLCSRLILSLWYLIEGFGFK